EPARLGKRVWEGKEGGRAWRIVRRVRHEHADPPHPLALLRARRERPRRRAAEGDQQFPPSDGDCHTPLPHEVLKRKDTTPPPSRSNSAGTWGGRSPGRRAQPALRLVDGLSAGGAKPF